MRILKGKISDRIQLRSPRLFSLRRTGDVSLEGARREVREYAKKLRVKAK